MLHHKPQIEITSYNSTYKYMIISFQANIFTFALFELFASHLWGHMEKFTEFEIPEVYQYYFFDFLQMSYL